MSNIRKMIVWASGLIEFIGDRDEPDGSILVCATRHPHALEQLLGHVHDQSILYDFGDVVGLRVPGIDPKRPDPGADFDAVDELIWWRDDLRELIGDDADIEWNRP